MHPPSDRGQDDSDDRFDLARDLRTRESEHRPAEQHDTGISSSITLITVVARMMRATVDLDDEAVADE